MWTFHRSFEGVTSSQAAYFYFGGEGDAVAGSTTTLFGLGFGATLWGMLRFRRGAAIWHGGGGR